MHATILEALHAQMAMSQASPLPSHPLTEDQAANGEHAPLPPSSPSPHASSPSLSRSSSPSPQAISKRSHISRTYKNGKRLRPTRANPHYGLLVAKKGDKDYSIVRSGRLFGPMTEGKVTQHFVECMDCILILCECVHDETGCWLQVSAGHPNSRGEHIHWESPSFEGDTPDMVFERLNALMKTIYSTLKTACRQDIASVEFQAAQCLRQRDEANQRVKEQQNILSQLALYLTTQGTSIEQIWGNGSQGGSTMPTSGGR
ncbi:hypothetical protein PM082_009188 [Marasmius tenuissimus]|nr:hypothetical protein PM082_009188 [Marasmius tenuissimus]